MVLQKKDSTEIYKYVTRSFFTTLLDLSVNGTPEILRELTIIDNDKDACMEVYRHSLCLFLGLSSTLTYPELASVCEIVSKLFLNDTKLQYITKKCDDCKKGFLEACVHCIVASRNIARGVKHE